MTTLPATRRRDTPNSHSKTVRLWSPEAGEEHVGFFRVPGTAVTFKEHTNEVLRYDREVVSKVREWIAWKLRLGLTMVSKPTVYVPTDSPTAGPDAEPEDGDDMRVYVRATFRQVNPKFMPLDVFLDRKDSADRYGIDLEAKRLAGNQLPAQTQEMVADGERNPMDLAERRRARLGLKRTVQTKTDEYGDRVAAEATVDPK